MIGEDVDLIGAARLYPQLTERAVVDLVNGLEVVKGHLRSRKEPHPLVRRLWNGVTGRAAREQYLIDINLTTGLDAVTQWLQDLQAFQAESDVAIATVATKVAEVRRAAFETSKLVAFLEERLDALSRRVDVLEARSKGESQPRQVLQRWRMASDVSSYPPAVLAFLMVDELWWGDFGRYCRVTRDLRDAERLIDFVSNEIGELIAARLGCDARQLLPVERMFESFTQMRADDRAIVAYLAESRIPKPTPLVTAIARHAESDVDAPLDDPRLPRVISPAGVAARLFHESRRLTDAFGSNGHVE